MKRIAASAGMLVLIAFSLAAAVWDGSAVAGVSEDFPGDGLYAACNSFPRDTSVTVTNLENGKTVTVTVTGGVENPGVFIALSPKAAAALDMRAGSAARIRAVALTASQAEATLPPTRAGESADPDYNPRVYVDREKAAVAAAASAANTASAAPTAPAVAPAAVAIAPAAVATAPSAVVAPQNAEIIPKLGEPSKAVSPAVPKLTEPTLGATPPSAAAKTPAPVTPNAVPPAAVAQATPSAAATPTRTPRAEALPLAEASPVFPGSPKPSPLGMTLPSPDLPTIPATIAPRARLGYLAQAPEILGGSIPQPRKPAVPKLAVTEPAISGAAVAPAAATSVPKPPEKASVTALARPSPYPPALALRLPEPNPAFVPEELPEAILDRITAPSKLAPVPLLAEAPPSALATKAGLEAIALERPSYAAEVEAAALAEASPLSPSEALGVNKPSATGGGYATLSLDEASLPGYPEVIASLAPAKNGAAPEAGIALDEAAPPGEPEAIAYRRTVAPNAGLAELQTPDVPTPQESLEAGRPNAVEPSQTIAELAEPGPESPTAGPESAVALSAEKPALAVTPGAELAAPGVPSPSESIGGEKPATPKPGEAIVELQPAELRPPKAATTTATPAQPPAVATIRGTTPSGAAMPPASVPMIKGLSKGSFYVQIGVFGTNDSLQSAIAGFKSTYPLAVESLTTKAGTAAYRLFVGPLSRDEGGIVLIRMRSLGFKDAYIRLGT